MFAGEERGFSEDSFPIGSDEAEAQISSLFNIL